MKGTIDDYIKYRILKSKEIFSDALLLAENERWNSCMNRLYYSAYYMASALLCKHKIKADTHNGVKIQLFLNFVKNGSLDKDLAKLYSHLFDWRQESDYADFVEFDDRVVKPLIPRVKELSERLEGLIYGS